MKGEYEAEIRVYDEIHEHILTMADALSDGIAAQFPNRFVELLRPAPAPVAGAGRDGDGAAAPSPEGPRPGRSAAAASSPTRQLASSVAQEAAAGPRERARRMRVPTRRAAPPDAAPPAHPMATARP
jgi:hypothetical protein